VSWTLGGAAARARAPLQRGLLFMERKPAQDDRIVDGHNAP
jgi:hypothetical protein